MIKHDEVRQHLSMWSRSARPLMREYITQQAQRESDLLMQVTEYGMSEKELKKLVKEYFEVKRKFYNEKQDVKYALRMMELEETIKEMVGV